MIKSENKIIQSNYLIENKPRMSIDESRLFLSVISLIDRDDKEFKIYDIAVTDFAKTWQISADAAYTPFFKAGKGLQSKQFLDEKINNKGKEDGLATSFISSFRYVKGEGFAHIRIDPEFMPYLIDLKETYTQYILQNVVNLDSVNSIRLYELMKQYESIRKRNFRIADFKRIMGFSGMYDNISNLKRVVLDKTKEEINANTDIIIDYKVIGRGLSAEIHFTIKSKRKIPISTELTDRQPIDKELIDHASEILKLNKIDESGEDFISWILKGSGNKEIKNQTSYIKTCLENVENVLRFKKSIESENILKIKKIKIKSELEEIEKLESEKAQEEVDKFMSVIPESIQNMSEGLEKIKAISAFRAELDNSKEYS